MEDMKEKKSGVFILVLVIIAVFIHIYSNDSTRVENQYSTVVYPAFSSFLRYLFGWLPFSIGDVLYGLVIIWLIWKAIKGIRAVFKKQVTKQNFLAGGGKIIRVLLITYIIFNLFWGINYNRVGIADQLHLKMDKYSLEDLKMLNSLLVEKVNASKQTLMNQGTEYPSNKALFSKVHDAYREAEKLYPFLHYQPVSLKPSIWGWFGNYLGFTGYYNPFTGEAQLNTTVPKFLQPFVACHEVGHQLGYAKEMEANFVGYLSATASKDTLFSYSVYLDMFIYSNRNLFESDSLAARGFDKQLSVPVMADLKQLKVFYAAHRKPVEPVLRWLYGVYLKQNQQPQGVFSYDEVTAFLIAYYKKNGRI